MNDHSQNQPPPADSDRILVAVDEEYALAQIVGRGSYKISKSLKEFAVKVIENGTPAFIVDLKNCIGMDSTFMGVLAGISQRLQEESDRKVILCQVSGKLLKLMNTLGLNHLVDIRDDIPSGKPEELTHLKPAEETPLESAQTMLDAHENLVAMDEENRLRFQDVLEYLREDIHRQN